MPQKKGEAQYWHVIELMKTREERLGVSAGWAWYDDPKRFSFSCARYKFVAKLFQGRRRVLEAGCGDGFFSRIVRQSVEELIAVDFSSDFIESAKANASDRWTIDFQVHDFLDGPVGGSFDGIYSLDVLEHINIADEDRFIRNMIAPLDPHGVVIIGTPSLESQVYASTQSKEGHVNCKTQSESCRTMLKYFHNVFMFSMNDEVVHTGFDKMSHYNIALCCGKRELM